MGELARGLAAQILNPFCKGAIRDVKRFWPMPWDENSKAADDAEMRRIIEMPPEQKQLEARQFLEKIRYNGKQSQSESQG